MNKKPQSIAITGGRGRLAQVIAPFFRKRGYQVDLFSREAGGGFLELQQLYHPEVMERYEFLLHAAWSSVPVTSEETPGIEERFDFLLLERLLSSWEYMARVVRREGKGVLPRFIFFSSASVYGNTRELPASEEMICCPLSGYARAKCEAEQSILKARERDPLLSSIILRITNILGIDSNPKHPQGILPRLLQAQKEEKPLSIWGDGNAIKDYLWIDDFLRALEAILEHFSPGIYNLGSGKSYSLHQLIRWIEVATNKSILRQYLPSYEWDVQHSKIDISAFMSQFEWVPRIDIPEAVASFAKKSLLTSS